MKTYISPGEALADVLKQLDISQEDFAQIIGKPSRLVSEIVNSKRSLTSPIARNICFALKELSEHVPETNVLTEDMFEPVFWLRLQYDYDLMRHANDDENVDAVTLRSSLYTWTPVRELKSRHFIPDKRNAGELEKEILSLYGEDDFSSLQQSIKTVLGATNFRQAGDLNPYLGAWLLLAKRIVGSNVSRLKSFDREKVLLIAQNANEYSRSKEGISKILKDFSSAGLTVKIFPSFSKTKVDGASTFIEEDKPLIVMTLRYDRIDNFFFTLLHEVGHVVLGHAGINAACFDDLNNIDVTDQKEKEANDFAQKMLRTNDVSNVNPDVVNRRFIVQSADSKNVHPGIIVGAMQHDKVLDYWNYREYLVKIKNLVEDKFFLQAV